MPLWQPLHQIVNFNLSGCSRSHKVVVEIEYMELQKKFRIMEGDRKAYNEKAQATIRQQRCSIKIVGIICLLILNRQQIEKVKKDNEALQEQLDLATRTVASLESVQIAQQLARLADQKSVPVLVC